MCREWAAGVAGTGRDVRTGYGTMRPYVTARGVWRFAGVSVPGPANARPRSGHNGNKLWRGPDGKKPGRVNHTGLGIGEKTG